MLERGSVIHHLIVHLLLAIRGLISVVSLTFRSGSKLHSLLVFLTGRV